MNQPAPRLPQNPLPGMLIGVGLNLVIYAMAPNVFTAFCFGLSVGIAGAAYGYHRVICEVILGTHRVLHDVFNDLLKDRLRP